MNTTKIWEELEIKDDYIFAKVMRIRIYARLYWKSCCTSKLKI